MGHWTHVLEVDDPEVGPAGLAFLVKSPRLKELLTPGTRLDDGPLQLVAGAKEMRTLELSGTRVTDQGLKVIGGFTKLNRLDVSDCDVTDDGLGYLSHLKRLVSVSLSGTRITDAGIQHIGELNLEFLSLESTKTSDACLKHLKGMRHLNCLRIHGTRITPEVAVETLGVPSGVIDFSDSRAP